MVTSDNGAPRPMTTATTAAKAKGDLRGQEANIWDGGHREPFVARWPGRIAAASESDALVFLGIFPDVPSIRRLVGSVLMEIDDEWQVGRRYFSLDSMRKLSMPELTEIVAATPLRLAPVR